MAQKVKAHVIWLACIGDCLGVGSSAPRHAQHRLVGKKGIAGDTVTQTKASKAISEHLETHNTQLHSVTCWTLPNAIKTSPRLKQRTIETRIWAHTTEDLGKLHYARIQVQTLWTGTKYTHRTPANPHNRYHQSSAKDEQESLLAEEFKKTTIWVQASRCRCCCTVNTCSRSSVQNLQKKACNMDQPAGASVSLSQTQKGAGSIQPPTMRYK